MSVAVILGSAFSEPVLAGRVLEPEKISTPFGDVELHRRSGSGRDGWVLFRHGMPHRYLPHQIPYRAQTAALKQVGSGALLSTSSVGVLDRSVPLDVPVVVGDIIMVNNRLPDGTACSMFVEPTVEQGHLVLAEGLISDALTRQVERFIEEEGTNSHPRAVFLYAEGPRNKTAAENALWARLGAQINSMTVAPEVVLANEMEIPTAAVTVGHKYSLPGERDRLAQGPMDQSLQVGAAAISRVASAFLDKAEPVEFSNRIYRY